MTVFRFIFANLDYFRRRFWLSLCVGLVYSIASLGVPLLLAEFTQSGLSQHDLVVLIAGLLGIIVVELGSAWYMRRYSEAMANQFANHVRQKYFARLEQLPLNDLAKNHSGYTLSLVNQIAGGMTTIFFDTFWTFTGILANVGFLAYFTASKSWGLTFLNLAVFVIFVIVSTLLARKMTALADRRSKSGARFSQYFVDFMSNLVTVKRLGVRSFAQHKLRAQADENNAHIQQFQNSHAARWLLLHSIYYMANFATIGYLLYEISQGTMPASLLILFIAFYGNIRGIIERIAENIITFTEMRVYINNLEDLLRGHNAASGTEIADWREISLQNITHRHANNAATIKIPELTITKGQKVCLYGPSGEGKTTALNIIANYVQPQAGERHIGGTPYVSLGSDWFSEHAAFISQETELFNLSIKDNLALGQKHSDAALKALLKELDLQPWLDGLEHGLNTIVGEKGVRLSAGQKQRLNIARGILLDRPLYFLDEPTSHLDEATEKIVVATLKKRLAGKTVVVVTHRPAIKEICDTFYKMRNHTLQPDV